MKSSKLSLIDSLSQEMNSLEMTEESLKNFLMKLTQVQSYIEQNEPNLTEHRLQLEKINQQLNSMLKQITQITTLENEIASINSLMSQSQQSIKTLHSNLNNVKIDTNLINKQLQTALSEAQPIFHQTIESFTQQFRVKTIAISLLIVIVLLLPISIYLLYQSSTNIKLISQQKTEIQYNAQIIELQQNQIQAEAIRQSRR